MNIVFTSEYMNRKRQEYNLNKLKYIREVIIHGLSSSLNENSVCCHMGFIESETNEYGAFDSGFDLIDCKNVIFNKSRYIRNYKKYIKLMEDINNNLYPGFTKDFIVVYNENKNRTDIPRTIYIE